MSANARVFIATFTILVGGCGCKSNKLQNQQGSLEVQVGDAGVSGGADDFGAVCPNSSAVQQLAIVNNSLGDVEVTAIAVTGGDFKANIPTLPFTIPAGGQQALPLTFAPTTTGPAAGTLTITSDAVNNPTTVNLTGIGQSGAPQPVYSGTCGQSSSCTAIQWVGVSVGSYVDDTLTITDTGCPTLVLESAVIVGADGGEGPFSLPTIPALPANIAPGTPLALDVRYSPSGIGLDRATLTLTTNDPVNSFGGSSSPGVFVYNLNGAGQAPQCQLTPSPYDFGAVQEGVPVTATFTVTNVGSASCTLQAPTLATPGGGFSIGNAWTAGTVLAPQGGGSNTVSCTVTFDSPGSGLFQDTLDVAYSSSQGSGTLTSNLIAHSAGSLCVSPDPVLVPATPNAAVLYCGPASASVWIGNCGSANLTVSSLTFGSSPPANLFSVTLPAGTTLPATVDADGGFFVTLIYADDGQHTTPATQMTVVSDDPSAPDGGTEISVIAEALPVPVPGDTPAQVSGTVGVNQTTVFAAEPGSDAPLYKYVWSIVPKGCAGATLVADGGMATVTATSAGNCNICFQEYELPTEGGDNCGIDSGPVGNKCTQYNP